VLHELTPCSGSLEEARRQGWLPHLQTRSARRAASSRACCRAGVRGAALPPIRFGPDRRYALVGEAPAYDRSELRAFQVGGQRGACGPYVLALEPLCEVRVDRSGALLCLLVNAFTGGGEL
jgi:hypothetical protein